MKKRGAKSPARLRAPRRAGDLDSFHELWRIADRVLHFSTGHESEVEITAAVDALTRFANNAIHQNVAEEVRHVSLRVIVNGRTARVTTNKADDASLRNLVESAVSLARFQPKNKDAMPMPGPQKQPPVRRFFDPTAEATPDDRAAVVRRIVRLAASRKQTAAGVYATGWSRAVFANSRGLRGEHAESKAEFSVTMMEQNSSGWAKATSPDARLFNPLALAANASENASASRNPRELPPGHYTVILEPSAVLDLAGFLFYDFAATAVQDKRSCLTGRMGKPLFGKNITLWDDVYHPLQSGVPFDGEGMPRQRVCLVENGVPRNLVYARATARKKKARPTGHGLPLPNEFGEAPMNLVFGGGSSSVDEMVRGTERGILVARLWYIREVDPYEKIMTGMTRDGTFLVENGRVVCGIRNFRFNQSLIAMLANVEELGAAVRASGEESFDMVVPAMKVRDFHFTEVTRF